jgi:hypothetical protein
MDGRVAFPAPFLTPQAKGVATWSSGSSVRFIEIGLVGDSTFVRVANIFSFSCINITLNPQLDTLEFSNLLFSLVWIDPRFLHNLLGLHRLLAVEFHSLRLDVPDLPVREDFSCFRALPLHKLP